jgi:hypothetical protein
MHVSTSPFDVFQMLLEGFETIQANYEHQMVVWKCAFRLHCAFVRYIHVQTALSCSYSLGGITDLQYVLNTECGIILSINLFVSMLSESFLLVNSEQWNLLVDHLRS